MGLLDRLLGQPTPTPGPAASIATLDSRSISFAAQRIDPTVRPDRRQHTANAKRSDEMWNAYDGVGEIGYVVDFFGNAMRRVRMFAAGIDDPEQGPVPLAECSWASAQLAADAAALLDRVRSVEHGQGEVLSQMAVNLKVTGAGNLYAEPDDVLAQEDWQVLSTSSLVWHRGRWSRKTDPTDRRPEPVNPDTLWRFWQRHPRWPGLAYSEMSRVLGHAENLQLLERAARNQGRSRVAGAGMLLMSNRVAFKPLGPRKPGARDFFDDVLEHMTAPMLDEGSVASFAPMLVDVDTDDVTKVAQHLRFDQSLTEIEAQREERLLRRIGQGLDGPPELVTGFHDVKFANGLIIQQETYEAHVEPLALRIADILAVAVLRAGLLALGYPTATVARVLTGVDPSDLIRRTNTVSDAKDGHAALVISDESYRTALGFTEDDKPSDEELLRRMALKRGMTTDQLTRELLRDYAGADLIDEDEPAAPLELPAAPEGDDADEEPAEAVVASAASTLGSRLETIDANLTSRLLGAAESAVERALERAAGRTRNRARRTEWAHTCRGPARGLLARLGAEGIAALAADDLVTDADFDTLRDQWGDWIPAAHSSAIGELNDAVDTDVDLGQPDDDFDAGWAVLVALLVGATRTALATPADELIDPTVDGEGDPAAIVQPGYVRAALARAGGAIGSESPGGAVMVDGGTRPAGGIATGEALLRAAVDAGLQLVGWSWQVGAPARPFPPHQALAGVSFTQPDSTELANVTGQWPGNSHWYVGDHKGCRCTAEPRFEPISSN